MRFAPVTLAAILAVTPAAAQDSKVGFGSEAPEFPPGVFADGRRYSLADLRGKVVVLFFYESGCPTCKKSIPERNEVVKAFKDKPVKFLAVGAGDPAGEVAAYGRETGLAMPAFVDSLSLMEGRYGLEISLKNIYQFRVIGPDGKVIGMSMGKADLEKMVAAAKPEWKYKAEGQPAKLDPAVDALEWGQYALGMKLLAPLRKSPVKELAAAANGVFDKVKAEAAGWKEEAAGAAGAEPVKAYDLYAKVVEALPGDDMARAAAVAMSNLKTKKPVMAELAARKALNDLDVKTAGAGPAQRKAAAQLFTGVAKKHPNTAAGAKATAVAEELAK